MSEKGDPRFYELRNALLEDADAAFAQIRSDRSLLDVRSGLGETLMHWFAVEYREDIVRELLKLGSKVDPTNHFGSTPFADIIGLKNQSMCRLLLEHGAAIDPLNQLGETPLMQAASIGMVSMCLFLLSMGASASFINAEGESVLEAAVNGGRIEVVEVILDNLPPETDINSLIGDCNRDTLEYIESDITKLLRKRGLRFS